MYYLLESSNGKIIVVGQFYTLLEAEEESNRLCNNYCDYLVTKLI